MINEDQFMEQVRNANDRKPYEMGIICGYIMEVREVFRKYGDNEDGFYRSKLVEAISTAAPVISAHAETVEQEKALYAAAYAAANTRKNETEKRIKFWQGVAFALGFITIWYCAIRMVIWLYPFFPAMLKAVDSPL